MDDAFIGRYAVSLRVSRLEEELTQIEDQLRYWNPIRQLLSQSKEPLFTHFLSKIPWQKSKKHTCAAWRLSMK